MDALFVVDGLATRMKEMDALLLTSSSLSLSSVKRRKKKGSNNNSSSKLNNSGHFYQLMTTCDKESGYTPLHYAIIQRDLMTLLLLLKHTSMPSLERDVVLSSLETTEAAVAGNGYLRMVLILMFYLVVTIMLVRYRQHQQQR